MSAEEASDRRLPKLVAFVLVHNSLRLNIDCNNCERILVNGLETQNY